MGTQLRPGDIIMINRKHRMVFMVVIVLAALGQAQTFATIYNFTGGSDGGNPYAGLIQDSAGNLYGTALNGGSGHYYADGVVFKMNTSGTETTVQFRRVSRRGMARDTGGSG